MIQEVMTAGQLAQYLQLDEQTVYRKARRGEIPTVKIGKTLRFKRDVINTWLKLSSLQWSSKKRTDLRQWAQKYAQTQKIKESSIEKSISRKRHKK